MNATAHHTGIIKVGNSLGIRFPKDYLKALGKDVVLEKTNEQNTVTGNHSAILGGSGNNVTHNWASASGYSVTSVMDCAFHSNNLVIQNIPVVTTAFAWGGLANGQVYTMTAPNTGLGCSPLFIR